MASCIAPSSGSATLMQQQACRPWFIGSAGGAARGLRQDARRRRVGHTPRALFGGGELQLLADLAELGISSQLAANSFEPQLRPEILVAAGCAAVPPLLFWARIATSALKRQRDMDDAKAAEEQRQRDREELKRKITGQNNG